MKNMGTRGSVPAVKDIPRDPRVDPQPGDVPQMGPLGKLVAIREFACVYAILFRNAGVAIQFSEESHKSPTNEYGLVVYEYYDTVEGAIEAEYTRIMAGVAK